MIIPVRLGDGACEKTHEWVLLELQGVIETPRADTPHGLDVGALSYKEVRGVGGVWVLVVGAAGAAGCD